MDTHEKLYDGELDLKSTLVAEEEVRQHFNITSPQAVTVIGYAMKINGIRHQSVKDVIATVSEAKGKAVDAMTEDERLLLLELGYLRRKNLPFTSSSKVAGRNDPCPCGSGEKYKRCCLDMAKAHDVERYKYGK